MSGLFARLLAWFAPSALATAAAVGAALLAALGAQTLRLHSTQAALADARTQTAQVKIAWTLDRQQAETQAAKTQAEYRDEEQRVARQRQEVTDESQRFAALAAADASARRSAVDRLRNATTAAAVGCRAAPRHPAAVAVSPAASSPGDLLAHVQLRMGEAAGRVVEYADRLRASAQQCAGEYNALMPTTIALPRMRLGEP